MFGSMLRLELLGNHEPLDHEQRCMGIRRSRVAVGGVVAAFFDATSESVPDEPRAAGARAHPAANIAPLNMVAPPRTIRGRSARCQSYDASCVWRPGASVAP